MKTTTKLKLTLALIASVFAIESVNANNWPTEKTKKADTEKSIQHYFKFPQILIPQLSPNKLESIKVEVLFTTNYLGNVNFVLAKTENKELKKEIENQFLKLNIKSVKSEVVNSVTLNFKTI